MKFPVKPMLLRRSEVPLHPGDWWYEPKLDGSRLMYYFDGKTVRLSTRSGREVTHLYPEIAVPLDKPTILDGELVSLDDRGVPDFQKLQPRLMKLATSPTVVYAVFDVLWHDDKRLNLRTYEFRRELLERLERPISFSLVPRSRSLTLDNVLKAGFEGVVSKRGASQYLPGTRSVNWFKTTPVHSAVAVVCGYTPGKGSREGMIGSLVLGLWDDEDDTLLHIGAVGTGFTQESAKYAFDLLRMVHTNRLTIKGDIPNDMVAVSPIYTVAVEFKGWTDSAKLRHPAFKGFVNEMEAASTSQQMRQ